MSKRWAFSVYDFDRGHSAPSNEADPILEQAREAMRSMDLWEVLGERSPIPISTDVPRGVTDQGAEDTN